MIVSLMLATVLLGATDPDGVIMTAPAGAQSVSSETMVDMPAGSPAQAVGTTPHGLTTSQQIDQWLESSKGGLAPFEEGARAEPADYERRMQGEVTAAIGTQGYRGFSASVDIPVGESAWLSLHVAKSEGDRSYGAYRDYDDPYGFYGPRYAPSADPMPKTEDRR